MRLDYSNSTQLRSNVSGTLLHMRNRHMVILDLLLFGLAPFVALLLRIDGFQGIARYTHVLVIYTLCAVIVRSVVYLRMGLYRRYWRYASVDDLVQIGAAVFVSTVFVFIAYVVAVQLLAEFTTLTLKPTLPRSIPILDALLVLLSTAGIRFLPRLAERWQYHQPHGKVRRVGIMGAGEAGVTILREIRKSPNLGLDVVCFFDDNLEKQRVEIHGVPVRGTRGRIPRIVNEAKLDLVILAIPTASGRDIREIVQICQKAQVETKTIPGVFELIDGTVHVNQLRNVELTDLLRRSPVQTDTLAVTGLIKGKRVLVTGGGGSIGRELCRQILDAEPAQLVLLGHGENSIFEAQRELRQMLQTRGKLAEKLGEPGTFITAVIADIRFGERIKGIFCQLEPEIVFHAAAHKHVPLMEMNPAEAITNNVEGTRNVVNAAVAAGVRNFVMISTDKAVNPTNVMGASKRTAELIVLRTAREHNLPYVAVRFGNVLGSRGSVVPIFQKQIAAGGPITVTHPDIRRYFMTIPEAVQLVLQAAVLGRCGEVFVLDMGQPVRIVEMAETLIRLSGYEVGRDIEISFTGLRPGEKLFEELFIEGETYAHTAHNKIFVAHNAGAFIPEHLDASVARLSDAARRNDRDDIIGGLMGLIPEYTSTTGTPPVASKPSAKEPSLQLSLSAA